jgi:XTP/dITP diphosphohydrolase
MHTLIFASGNRHKAEEIEAALPEGYQIITMKEAGIDEEIPEPFDTIEENSKHKARFLLQKLHTDCFAEDTGLEVEALHGEPGVKSARYAGEEKNFEKNIKKLLQSMQNITDRQARFKTVITLLQQGKEVIFEGICEGIIAEKPSGTNGFGYDAVFLPNGSAKTFAEMTLNEKNQYSHRKKALDKMIQYLEQTNP